MSERSHDRPAGVAARKRPSRRALRVWTATWWSGLLVSALVGSPWTGWAQSAASPPTAPSEKTAGPASTSKPLKGDPASPRPTAEPGATSSTPLLERLPTEIQYLKNDQGELVPVPRDASVEGYLEYLRQRRTTPTPTPPLVSFTSVELQGEVQGELAHLRAKVVLEMTGTGTLPVTLGMGEAVIQQVRVQSAGRALYAGKDVERGYQWWLTGAGTYEFELQLVVALRRAPPRRRLVLSLPASPVTSARLQIPHSDIVPRIQPEDAVLQTMPVGTGTEVYATGFGARLDVSWQAVPATGSQTASLDAVTTLLVRGSGEGLYVEATQLVRALNGVFREVQVRLPDQAELLQVDGSEIAESRTDPERPSVVTLSLTGPTAGPVTFRWRVRIPPSERRRLVLEGFSVEGAKRQSGSIGLVEVDDARWTVVEAGEPHLERMNLAEFRALSNGVPVVRAYRFYAQPFRLPLSLEAVSAYYEVQPLYGIYAAEEELRLEGRYRVRTFRGQLEQLVLHWPGWRTEGWVLEGFQPQGSLVTGFSTNDAAGSEGRIVVSLSDRAKDSFEVRFSARRSRRSGEESRLTLPLMEGSGPTLPQAQVVVVPAINVDVELNPRGETVLRRLGRDAAPASEDLGFERGLRTEAYRLETEERQFSLRVTPQPQRVRVTSQVKVQLGSRRLEIRQKIDHLVEYVRMNDFAIVVPATIADRVLFHHAGKELLPEWVESGRTGEKVAWLMLPPQPPGTVSLELTWEQPLPETWLGDRPVPLDIPLARSEFAPTEQTTLEVWQTGWFTVSTDDPVWLLQHADPERVRWQTAAAVSEFPLILSPTDEAEGAFQISRAIVQVWLDRLGGQVYRFQARLTGGTPDLFVHLPAKSTPPKIWWDQQPLAGSQVVEIPHGSRQFSLRLAEPLDPSSEHLLTVDYELPTGHPLAGTAGVVLWAPRLPQAQWTGQVIWEVDLPMDQHLWGPPTAAAAMYHWERTGWYWQRVSYPRPEELLSWVRGSLSAPPELPTGPGARRYVFRQLGKVQELRFRTLSTPMALVLGAGFSLLVGFLSMRFDWLQALIIVLGAICGLALLSLWYLAELELLLQPMLLGAIFPVVIAAAEAWQQRRAMAATWALSASVSDYRPGSSEIPPTQSLQTLRGDSATVLRAPLTGDSNATRLPAESQAG